MNLVLEIFLYITLLVYSIAFIIQRINFKRFHRLSHYQVRDYPTVTILIPARNEEGNIGACVNTLLAQDYPEFEVIVLNDRSTDDTGKILKDIAKNKIKN